MNIGFELSYIDPKTPIKVDEEGYFIYNTVAIQSLEDKSNQIRKKFLNFHRDGSCFEVNSPIFMENFSAIEYYENVTRVMRKLRLVTHDKRTDGGGLHFHIDLKADASFDKYIIFCEEINKVPYLNWIFNNPVDTGNANNPTIAFLTKYPNDKYNNIDDFALKMLKVHKEYALIVHENPKRIQYRFFDMPYNKQEFVLLLEFIQKLHNRIMYSEYLDSGCTLGYFDFQEYTYLDINKMISKFKNLLNLLCLDYKDYEVFVKRNMKMRYKYGKEYLV